MKNDITGDEIKSKPATDAYRDSPFWETRKFSEFIRNATPEEKEIVYSKVIKESNALQEDRIREASNPLPHFLKKQAC